MVRIGLEQPGGNVRYRVVGRGDSEAEDGVVVVLATRSRCDRSRQPANPGPRSRTWCAL